MQPNSLEYLDLPESLARPWQAQVISLEEALALNDLWALQQRRRSFQVPTWLEPAVERILAYQLLDGMETEGVLAH